MEEKEEEEEDAVELCRELRGERGRRLDGVVGLYAELKCDDVANDLLDGTGRIEDPSESALKKG